MHGGTEGLGAPRGNQNALKHGACTKEALQRRAEMRELIREARKLLKSLLAAPPKRLPFARSVTGAHHRNWASILAFGLRASSLARRALSLLKSNARPPSPPPSK
jgi:hypothetical protein